MDTIVLTGATAPPVSKTDTPREKAEAATIARSTEHPLASPSPAGAWALDASTTISRPETPAASPIAAIDVPISIAAGRSPMRVSDVETQTHLPPVDAKAAELPPNAAIAASLPMPSVPASTPADQVVETIKNALAQPAKTEVRDLTSQPSKIARTMILQLSPGTLGTVNIRLHLASGALDLQLETSDPETLGLLTRDRETLSKALRSEAYDLGNLVIRAADPSSAPAPTAMREQAGAQGGDNWGGQSSSEQRPSNSSNNDRSPDRRGAPQQDTKHDDTARKPRESRTGSLYL